jgi:hypothetical protein
MIKSSSLLLCVLLWPRSLSESPSSPIQDLHVGCLDSRSEFCKPPNRKFLLPGPCYLSPGPTTRTCCPQASAVACGLSRVARAFCGLLEHPAWHPRVLCNFPRLCDCGGLLCLCSWLSRPPFSGRCFPNGLSTTLLTTLLASDYCDRSAG